WSANGRRCRSTDLSWLLIAAIALPRLNCCFHFLAAVLCYRTDLHTSHLPRQSRKMRCAAADATILSHEIHPLSCDRLGGGACCRRLCSANGARALDDEPNYRRARAAAALYCRAGFSFTQIRSAAGAGRDSGHESPGYS